MENSKTERITHWRHLIRIVSVNKEKNTFTMCIPAFGWNEIIERDLSIIPESIIPEGIKPEQRLHVKVNIAVDDSAELTFKDWEPK